MQSKGRSKLYPQGSPRVAVNCWHIERGTYGRTASVAVVVDSAPWVVVNKFKPYLYWRIPVLKTHIYTGGSQFVGSPPGEPIRSTHLVTRIWPLHYLYTTLFVHLEFF